MLENFETVDQIDRFFTNCVNISNKADLLKILGIYSGFRHKMNSGFITNNVRLWEKINQLF